MVKRNWYKAKIFEHLWEGIGRNQDIWNSYLPIQMLMKSGAHIHKLTPTSWKSGPKPAECDFLFLFFFNQRQDFRDVNRNEITQHLEKYEQIKMYLPSSIKGKSCLTNLAEFVLGAKVENMQDRSSGANPHRFQKSHLNAAQDGRLIRKVSKNGIKTIVLERLRKWLGD